MTEGITKTLGKWQAYFDPNLAPYSNEFYEQLIEELGNEAITALSFYAMAIKQLPCFITTNYFLPRVKSVLSWYDFDTTNEISLGFEQSIFSEFVQLPMEGQNIILIEPKDSRGPQILLDPACYLFSLSYNEMPVVVGSQTFMENITSDIYSSATNSKIKVQIQRPSLRNRSVKS